MACSRAGTGPGQPRGQRQDRGLERDAGLLLRRLWLPLLVLLLCSAIGSFALARFYAGQVYDRWLLDSAMSLSELVKVQDGRASIEITPAVSRMFTWDTADEVHGEVVDAAGIEAGQRE